MYIGMMEKKSETAVMGYMGLGFFKCKGSTRASFVGMYLEGQKNLVSILIIPVVHVRTSVMPTSLHPKP